MLYRILALFSVLILAENSTAQNFNFSPYTTQGIGEFSLIPMPNNGGLGAGGVALADSNIYNPSNPASLAFLARQQPLLDISLSSRISNYSLGDMKSFRALTNISNLSLAIPVGKRIGFSFGLSPFANKGYELQSNTLQNGDSVFYSYLGKGSINSVNSNIAFKVLNLAKYQTSLGVNVAYLFGNTEQERRVIYGSNSSAGGADIKTTQVSSMYFKAALLHKMIVGKKETSSITFGATFAPEQSLSASRDYGLFYSNTIINRNSYDTLEFISGTKGTITLPQQWNVGLAYAFKSLSKDPLKVNDYLTTLFVDFGQSNWSNYDQKFTTSDSIRFINTQTFSVGLQFQPSITLSTKVAKSKWYNSLSYRAGFQSMSLPYQEFDVSNAYQVKQTSVTLGIGVPLRLQKTNSMLNFSLQAGNRNSGLSGGLSERFLIMNFGIHVAPANYDKWFKKYKLD